MKRAIFVAYKSHLASARGGVQACTAEYLAVLKAAGFDLDVVEVEHDRSLQARALRKLNASPYWRPMRKFDVAKIAERVAATSAEVVFLNQVALAGSLAAIASLERHRTRKFLLSHGCEITDQAHLVRLDRNLPLSGRLRPNKAIGLGATLRDEILARTLVDGVVALSPFDAECETWLGSRAVTWLPRTVSEDLVDWAPADNTFGFVGTLDHAPNLEGLVKVLEQLSTEDQHAFKIRVVGGPDRIGKWLSSSYASVDFLGMLDDGALKAEASCWTAFLHPIFSKARGCSTKLATGISWGIPIITTPEGRRGYIWHEGSLEEAHSAQGFVELMRKMQTAALSRIASRNTRLVCRSTPDIETVAGQLRSFLFT